MNAVPQLIVTPDNIIMPLCVIRTQMVVTFISAALSMFNTFMSIFWNTLDRNPLPVMTVLLLVYGYAMYKLNAEFDNFDVALTKQKEDYRALKEENEKLIKCIEQMTEEQKNLLKQLKDQVEVVSLLTEEREELKAQLSKKK